MWRQTNREKMAMWRWIQRLKLLAQAEEHLGLPEAEEDSSPKVYRESMALKIPCFWPSSLQNCETKNCCFKLHHLWYFVIAAVGN